MATPIGDDVLAAIVGALQTAVGTLVSGIFHGRAESGAQPPYLVVKVKPQKPEPISSGAYLQKFMIRIETRGAATDQPPKGVARGVLGVMKKIPLPFSVANTDQTVGAWPAEGEYGLDEETKDATDVLLAVSQWDLMVQGS